MWISPSYERDYRDWIARGHFDRLVASQHERVANGLQEEHPALISTCLAALATCYHHRGTVRLLERQSSGWNDIQAGYWALLYSLRFEIVAVTLPAWSRGRSFMHSTELVVAFAFSRLFHQDEDRAWLKQAIDRHFESASHVIAGQPGHTLVTAMMRESIDVNREELLNDRRACCKSRDAYPKRPTEVIPVGVIDIETMLHFPSEAAFQYADASFQPTEDGPMMDAIAAYHVMYP